MSDGVLVVWMAGIRPLRSVAVALTCFRFVLVADARWHGWVRSLFGHRCGVSNHRYNWLQESAKKTMLLSALSKSFA